MQADTLIDCSARMMILRRNFLDRVSTDADAIKGLVNPMDDTGILALRSLCHMLKGSANLLGLHALMNSAADLEREIRGRAQDRRSIMEKWATLLGNLSQCALDAG